MKGEGKKEREDEGDERGERPIFCETHIYRYENSIWQKMSELGQDFAPPSGFQQKQREIFLKIQIIPHSINLTFLLGFYVRATSKAI